MQGNLLFVGCSHTNGYINDYKNKNVKVWQNNNYAQIYAQDLADGQCYIYASSGAPNQVYPRWIRYVLNNHTVKGLVIQSTYHDRWLLANNLDLEFRQLDTDYFVHQATEAEKFILYDDYNTLDYNTIEWKEKANWNEVTLYKESCPDLNGGNDWPGFVQPYMHIKLHTEIFTHLKLEEYCKDIALIDAMCDNIPVYIWRINERVEFPKNFYTFSKLKNTKIIEIPANIWLKNNLNVDIETMKVDEEHYNEHAHRLIAHNFIPEVLNGN